MAFFIIDNEVYLRLAGFFGIFVSMAVWELAAPRRALSSPKGIRWTNNLLLTFINSLAVRLIFSGAAVGTALYAEENRIGLFHILGVPAWGAGIASIVLLDLAIYTQHVVFHLVPPLWRLHRMHHTDLDIDVTTGSRFHPVEIIISMGIKMVIVGLLGAPAWSVVAFEVLLNATAMFNHSNISMPLGIDRVLRCFVVTPDMHRVHHSVIIGETNSNYGFNLPWWDRLFRTYHAQPAAGHIGMRIGLANYRERKYLTLPWMLVIPFLSRER